MAKKIEKIKQSKKTESNGNAIDITRWQAAQLAERVAHEADPNNTAAHYAKVYAKYFSYVNAGVDLHGIHVVEIGPAFHPALAVCKNYGRSIIVEPMLNHELIQFCKQHNVVLVDQPVESDDFNTAIDQLRGEKENFIEVWLFNVMQHIIDPESFIIKCKAAGDRIRFFEPIDVPVATHHPHTYAFEDFTKWFGPVVNRYKGGSEGAGFHTADCAYGVWSRLW